MNRKILSVIIFGVSAVVIAAGLNFGGRETNQENQPSEVEDPASFVIGRNAINVEEQPIGKTANVSLVVLEAKGYVVIHELENEQPAEIIGVSELLDAGRSQNVLVDLTVNLEEERSYIAMLHKDDGNGMFDGETDPPTRGNDENASIIMMEFQASAGAEPGSSLSM